jgi:hypothetical protein
VLVALIVVSPPAGPPAACVPFVDPVTYGWARTLSSPLVTLVRYWSSTVTEVIVAPLGMTASNPKLP